LKISIITPNYNYSQYIPQLLNSIIQQEYQKWEHIIVDDGSTDNSVDVIKSYIQKDNRIKLIKQENKGQTPAINRALKDVTGEIVCWINSDDWFVNGIFKKAVSEFEKNKELDILYGDGIYFKVDENKFLLRRQLPFDYKLFTFIGFGLSVMSNTVFWKSNILKDTGTFNEEMVYNMDGEYFSRIFWNRKVKHIRNPVAYFRWHSEAKTIKNRGNNRTTLYNTELKKELETSLQNLNILYLLNTIKFKLLKRYYKIKRIILRFFHGHYFFNDFSQKYI
jgi:glycosyltransferase involved in cell wall biosynthesis